MEAPSSDGSNAGLASALGAAGLPPRDRFAFFVEQGLPCSAALAVVLRSMRSGPAKNSWKRVVFVADLIEEGSLDLQNGIAALRNLGIHPLSLAGTGKLQIRPATLDLLDLPAGCNINVVPFSQGLVLTGHPAIDRLPAGLRSWSLHLRHFPRLLDLGAGLEVAHDLRIEACGLLERLPESLGRISRVWIEGCSSLNGIPATLASDNLRLRDLPELMSPALPKGFTGQLSLGRCPRLHSLSVPTGRLTSIDFYDCSLERLEGLHLVREEFAAAHCPGFRWVPSGLEVAGSMKLTALPELAGLGRGLRIGGNLEMQQMPDLFILPEDLQVGGQIILSPATGSVIAPDRLKDKIIEIP